MGLFSSLFRRAETFRNELEAYVRAAGDSRALLWNEHLLTLVDEFPDTGKAIDLEDALAHWKSNGDLSEARAALNGLLQPGAASSPFWGAVPSLTVVEDSFGAVAQGLVLKPVVCDEQGPRVVDEAFLEENDTSLDELLDGEEQPPTLFERVDDGLFSVEHPAWLLWNVATASFPALEGAPVLIVLDATRLFVTGSRDARALTRLAQELIETVKSPPEDLLGFTYVVRDGALVPWLPSRRDEATRLAFVLLRRVALERAYQLQGDVLSKIFDGFVARFRVERPELLPVASVASWSRGVHAVIPAADVIGLSLSLTDHRMFALAQVLEHLGHHLQRLPKLWPPRYVTRGFPTDDDLVAMGPFVSDPLACFEVAEEPTLDVPAAHTLSREAFAKECLSILEALGVTGVEYSETGFGVQYEVELTAQLRAQVPADLQGEVGTKVLKQLGFRTPYERYGVLPDAERQVATRAYFSEFLNSFGARPAVDADAIMPLLQPACVAWTTPLEHGLRAGMEVVMPEPPLRAFTKGLNLTFVVDTPRTVQFLSKEQLVALTGSETALFERALENLRRATTQPLREVRPGLYESPIGDEYDATRIALATLFFSLPLKGRPVAFIPNRTTLLVAGSEDDENLLACAALVKEARLNDARPVTTMPLMLTADGWAPWVPPPARRASAALEALAKEAVEEELRHAADVVGARWPDVGLPAFATRVAHGRPELLSVVEGGEPVHLPKSDRVVVDGVEHDWASFAADHASRLVPVHETRGAWFRFTPP